MSQRELNKIAKNAVREAMRTRDFDKNRKRKNREEASKKSAASRARLMSSLEWFIIGILAYPIVGPMYQAAIHYYAR